MASRLEQLNNHLHRPNGRDAILQKHPDDIVATLSLRTALTKSNKGGFKDTKPDKLLFLLLQAVKERMNVQPDMVQDIVVGNVDCGYIGHYARMAALSAGFPDTTGTMALNRWCSSGLMAITNIANAIKSGSIEIGLAIGIETMSQETDKISLDVGDEISSSESALGCLQPMGQTSENVASDFNLSRDDMDGYAATSYQRAEHAQKNGYFKSEIVPLKTTITTPDNEEKEVIVDKDDGIRYGTTKENLLKVRSAFPQWEPGYSTGGNSSQTTDGAAAVLLMKRSKAEALGLPIVGKFVQATVVGCSPRIMGVAPAFAIPEVLKLTNLTKEDIDLYEINEAFASMMVWNLNKLQLPIEKVNVNGGAIAFGHPLGCTGARQVVTGLAELRRRKQKILCTSMCMATGQGAASIWVVE